jgi:GNAT superfamily N-acetyltransferase
MPDQIIKTRSPEQIEAARNLVWEFFDFLKSRYSEMTGEIDGYIKDRNVAEELERFGDYFLPPKGECFLAFHQGEPAGLVMLKPHGAGDGELNRMYVRDTARGHKIGRSLAQALVAEARAFGYRTLWLDAIYRHVEALPLYESLGFQRYTDSSAFGGEDARFIHMKLTLNTPE